MRAILLVCFSVISFSASAQWFSFSKHERFPLLQQVKDNSFKRFAKADAPKLVKLKTIDVGISEYNLGLAERIIIRTAQHNMRFREYNVASYNFSELANLYTQQNRFSEAKWYFLQSNNISRRSNNDKLTIANLICLAEVKSQIGDFTLAQDDLSEARQIALTHGWSADLLSVEKKLKEVQQKKVLNTKAGIKYAGNVKLEPSAVN